MVLLRINICSLQIIRAVILNNSMNFFRFSKKNDRKYTVILCSNNTIEQKKNEILFCYSSQIFTNCKYTILFFPAKQMLIFIKRRISKLSQNNIFNFIIFWIITWIIFFF